MDKKNYQTRNLHIENGIKNKNDEIGRRSFLLNSEANLRLVIGFVGCLMQEIKWSCSHPWF